MSDVPREPAATVAARMGQGSAGGTTGSQRPDEIRPDQTGGRDTGEALRRTGQDIRSAAGEVGAHARDTAGHVRHEAGSVAEDAMREGREVAQAVTQRASSFVDEQKAAGAEQAQGFARAFQRAADDLQDASPMLAGYVRDAAESVERMSGALRDRSVGDLAGGVEDFARRQPTAFLGISVLAGFALARFVKSSAENSAGMASQHGRGMASSYPSGMGAGSGMGTYPVDRGMSSGFAGPVPAPAPTAGAGPAGSGGLGSSAAALGGTAAPTTGTGAPGWVPTGGAHDEKPESASRPATTAAASLGGAAARDATIGRPPGATPTDRT